MTPTNGKAERRPSARDVIVDAAIRLLARNPGASSSALARRAGVGRATLHRHFRGRHELLAAIARTCLDETEAAVRAAVEGEAGATRRLRRMFEAVIPLGDRYHFLYHQPLRDDAAAAGQQRQLEWVAGLVEGLKAEGAVAADVPSAWVVAQIDQMVWAAWNEVAAGRIAAADAGALAVRTLLHGLGDRHER